MASLVILFGGDNKSTYGKWAGDEDLGNGQLENSKKDYDQQRAFACGIHHRDGRVQDLHLILACH